MRAFLIKELKKCYLYNSCDSRQYSTKRHHKYKFIKLQITDYYSADSFVLKKVRWKIDDIGDYLITGNVQRLGKILHYISDPKHAVLVKKITLSFPLILIIFIILYDLYFQQGKVSKIFYLLPFYFIFSIWVNLTEFMFCTEESLNETLFDFYYLPTEKVYLNLTEEEKSLIENYKFYGLKAFWPLHHQNEKESEEYFYIFNLKLSIYSKAQDYKS